MNKILYKYRNHGPNTDSIFINRTVFLATAEQLNDPFECSIMDLDREWLKNNVDKKMRESLAGFVLSSKNIHEQEFSFFGLKPQQAELSIKKVMSAGTVAKSYHAMRRFIERRTGRPPSDCRTLYARFDDQLLRTGIFSMSADPIQPLMWAHYTSDHKGICLGFELVPESKLADPLHCVPVRYSEKLPSIETEDLLMDAIGTISSTGLSTEITVSFKDPTFRSIVSTKPTCWSYEQEYRYIEKFGGVFPWPGRLAECTFGLRCTDEMRMHYRKLIEDYAIGEVAIFEIKKMPGTNSLQRVPLTPPVITGRGLNSPTEGVDDAADLDLQSFLNRIDDLIKGGLYDAAIEQVDFNLANHPRDPDLIIRKATAYGFVQEHRKAYDLFKRLSRLYPDSAEGWYGMGVALISMDRAHEAIRPLERAYALDPDHPSHALNLGNLLVAYPDRQLEGLECLRRAERLGHRRATRLIHEVETGVISPDQPPYHSSASKGRRKFARPKF